MINKKWDELLKDEFKKPYFKQLGVFVKNEYGKKTVYPDTGKKQSIQNIKIFLML